MRKIRVFVKMSIEIVKIGLRLNRRGKVGKEREGRVREGRVNKGREGIKYRSS